MTCLIRLSRRGSVPELHSARVEHNEGNLVSAKRQYLRCIAASIAFDIWCTLHSAMVFLFRGWLTEPPLRFGSFTPLRFFLECSLW